LEFQPNKLPAEIQLDYRTCFCMLQAVMKKHFPVFCVAAVAIALFTTAPQASAHERDTFKIGDKYYVFTVGSLNEPFVVDNTSGVDLRVSQLAGPPSAGGAKQNGTAVTGLEQTLKVDLIAGDKKETLSFDPSDEAPGAYAANFIPTVQTTYSYRIFGTINNTPVDLTFTCVPGEVSETAEDNTQVKVSDKITRLNKVGAFGCPADRKSMGFPEPSISSYDLNQNAQNLAATAQAAAKQASMAQALSIGGIVIGLIGLVVAGIALKRK
jgi:hypothetical protein